MKQCILTARPALLKLFACCILLSAFWGCKKTPEFYNELSSLPQIDNTAAYAYKSAYVVGDTMVITGKFQKNAQVSIGGVAATIVKVDSIAGPTLVINQKNVTVNEDQASILITAAMAGDNREVKITSGGYSATGSAIQVYTYGGPGSFNSILKAVQVTQTTLSGAYKFLYGVTGKGDVYYYAPNTKNLWHIAKDGTTTMLYDLSGLGITSFLAGGVDPQAQNLYFSVQVSSGYALYKLNLQNNSLAALNQSAGLSAPYEGAIGAVQMIVTGIYPDSKGNLYLGIGIGNLGSVPNFVPDAIALYSAANGNIHYVYKDLVYQQFYAGMPGIKIPAASIISVRFSPDENLLYAIGKYGTTGEMGIQLYDMSVNVLLQDLEPFNNNNNPASQYDVIAPFNGLNINLGTDNSANISFGFMPMPGRRLQVLLFQNYEAGASYGFPKWVVFDFANLRTYAYGLGQFQLDNGQYALRDADQLLNYDEAGNLYMTGNSLSYLLMTQPSN